MQVSLSAHASTGMPLEPAAGAANGVMALPQPHALSSPSGLQQSPPSARFSNESVASPGAQQADGSDAACLVSGAAAKPVNRFRGGSAESDGGDDLAGILHDEREDPGGEASPGGGGGGSRRPRQMVSLLARGLADQAAAAAAPPVIDSAALLQPPAGAEAGAAAAAAAKPKRSASWLLNLPHITTVRRMGKAEGFP